MLCRGGSRKFRRGGRVTTLPPPPPPHLWMKTSLFRRWSVQHCGRIRGAKLSNVNVSKDRIKEHFIKRFSGRLEGLGSNKDVLKKGGRGPSAPPLNPPMLCVACKTRRGDLSKNKTLPLYLPTNEHSVTSKFRIRTVERPKNSQTTNMFTDSLFGEGQATDNFTYVPFELEPALCY